MSMALNTSFDTSPASDQPMRSTRPAEGSAARPFGELLSSARKESDAPATDPAEPGAAAAAAASVAPAKGGKSGAEDENVEDAAEATADGDDDDELPAWLPFAAVDMQIPVKAPAAGTGVTVPAGLTGVRADGSATAAGLPGADAARAALPDASGAAGAEVAGGATAAPPQPAGDPAVQPSTGGAADGAALPVTATGAEQATAGPEVIRAPATPGQAAAPSLPPLPAASAQTAAAAPAAIAAAAAAPGQADASDPAVQLAPAGTVPSIAQQAMAQPGSASKAAPSWLALRVGAADASDAPGGQRFEAGLPDLAQTSLWLDARLSQAGAATPVTADAAAAPAGALTLGTDALVADAISSEWFDQLAADIGSLVDSDRREARLRLNPEALGMLDVRIETQNGRTTAHFGAETAAAHRLISENLNRLGDLIGENGLKLDQASVDLSDRRRQGDATPKQPESSNRRLAETSVRQETLSVPVPRVRSKSGFERFA